MLRSEKCVERSLACICLRLCRGILARQGASLEMLANGKHQAACGLSGPRGFKSPSRRHFTNYGFFLAYFV